MRLLLDESLPKPFSRLADQSLAYQQNLSRFAIAVLILRSRTNRVADLAALVPRLLEVRHHAGAQAIDRSCGRSEPAPRSQDVGRNGKFRVHPARYTTCLGTPLL